MARKICNRICVALFALCSALSAVEAKANDVPAFNQERAVRNYQAIMSGKKQYKDLTPIELQEISVILRALKSQLPENASPECKEAWQKAESAARDTISGADNLKRCLASGDYMDDCGSKFRQIKYSYAEYESAVSSVSSTCR